MDLLLLRSLAWVPKDRPRNSCNQQGSCRPQDRIRCASTKKGKAIDRVSILSIWCISHRLQVHANARSLLPQVPTPLDASCKPLINTNPSSSTANQSTLLVVERSGLHFTASTSALLHVRFRSHPLTAKQVNLGSGQAACCASPVICFAPDCSGIVFWFLGAWPCQPPF